MEAYLEATEDEAVVAENHGIVFVPCPLEQRRSASFGPPRLIFYKGIERTEAMPAPTFAMSNFERLRQIKIANPCNENWDAMQGDDKKRFCAGCRCFVHNIGALSPEEAEAALNQPGRVCTRVVMDPERGVLTRSGWVSRLLVAGAVAVTVAGCASTPVEVGAETHPIHQAESVSPRTIRPLLARSRWKRPPWATSPFRPLPSWARHPPSRPLLRSEDRPG